MKYIFGKSKIVVLIVGWKPSYRTLPLVCVWGEFPRRKKNVFRQASTMSGTRKKGYKKAISKSDEDDLNECTITFLIICMGIFQHADWLRVRHCP